LADVRPVTPRGTDAGQRAPQLRSLQMLRAVAALLVVMFHTGSIFGERTGQRIFDGIFSEGSRGVDLFFVLSGFVITYVHLRDWGRPRQLGFYLFNRLSRIYPSVWIMSALAVATYLAGQHFSVSVGVTGGDHSGKLAPWNIIAGAFLLPQTGFALVNVTWTLKHEMIFYLLFALLILDRRFMALLVLWQAAVLGCVLAGLRFEGSWLIYLLGPIKLEFGLGIACALLVIFREFFPALTRRTLPAIGLGFGALMFVGGAMVDTFRHDLLPVPELVIYGVGSALVVGCAALLELSGVRWRSPAAQFLGDASYSIYLVHFSVITQISGLLLALRIVPMGTIVYLAVGGFGVLAGCAFHILIDQPIQRVLRRAKSYLVGADRRMPGSNLVRGQACIARTESS